MATSDRRSPAASPIIPWIVAIDAALILLPPLHWLLRGDSPALSLTYVLGTPVLLLISLFALDRAAAISTPGIQHEEDES